jgi:hypothetical protein
MSRMIGDGVTACRRCTAFVWRNVCELMVWRIELAVAIEHHR